LILPVLGGVKIAEDAKNGVILHFLNDDVAVTLLPSLNDVIAQLCIGGHVPAAGILGG
jgi:hypothetical protein